MACPRAKPAVEPKVSVFVPLTPAVAAIEACEPFGTKVIAPAEKALVPTSREPP